jgi:hypothetical protein
VLASAITSRTPQFAFVLRLLGLLDWRYVPASGGTALSRDHVRKTLELERVKDLISDPATHYREALGWGDGTFDPVDIFRLARDFFRVEDDVEVGVQAGDPFLRIGAVVIRRDSSVTPPCLRLALVAGFDADRSGRVEMNDDWGAGLSSDLRMTGTVSARIRPHSRSRCSLQRPDHRWARGPLRPQPKRAALRRPRCRRTALSGRDQRDCRSGPEGELGASPTESPGSTRSRSPGSTASSSGSARATRTASWAACLAAPRSRGSLTSVSSGGQPAGCRRRAAEGSSSPFPCIATWGPSRCRSSTSVLGIGDDGTLSLETSTSLGAALGPLKATIDRLGARLDLQFTEGTDARFGPSISRCGSSRPPASDSRRRRPGSGAAASSPSTPTGGATPGSCSSPSARSR